MCTLPRTEFVNFKLNNSLNDAYQIISSVKTVLMEELDHVSHDKDSEKEQVEHVSH